RLVAGSPRRRAQRRPSRVRGRLTGPAGMPLAPARPSLRVVAPWSLTGGVICAALMAAVAWAVLSGGWVSSGGGAVVVAVAAAVEGALPAHARVPRLVTRVLAPVLALAAIAPTPLVPLPSDGVSRAL